MAKTKPGYVSKKKVVEDIKKANTPGKVKKPKDLRDANPHKSRRWV